MALPSLAFKIYEPVECLNRRRPCSLKERPNCLTETFLAICRNAVDTS